MELPPETGLIGMASWAAWKLIGPAAGEVAEASRRWTANRVKNIGRVVEMATEEAGQELDRPGSVHPRVAHRLLEEGSYCDDEVMQRYLSGMLRAARTEDGRDDRATYYINTLASMTANQVRLHHAIYAALSDVERSQSWKLTDGSGARRMCVRVPLPEAASLMSHDDETLPTDALAEAAFGLRREGLVGQDLSFDSILQLSMAVADEMWFAASPTAVGALLFLWGRGRPTSDADQIGRVPLRRLDPPAPRFVRVEVGQWFPEPPDEATLSERIQQDLVRNLRMGK